MSPTHTFRAIWPITDETVPYAELCKQAGAELPEIIARSRARLTSPGHFAVAPSAHVPGSGRVTESVLLYTAPAVALRPRAYWKGAA